MGFQLHKIDHIPGPLLHTSIRNFLHVCATAIYFCWLCHHLRGHVLCSTLCLSYIQLKISCLNDLYDQKIAVHKHTTSKHQHTFNEVWNHFNAGHYVETKERVWRNTANRQNIETKKDSPKSQQVIPQPPHYTSQATWSHLLCSLSLSLSLSRLRSRWCLELLCPPLLRSPSLLSWRRLCSCPPPPPLLPLRERLCGEQRWSAGRREGLAT